METLGGSGLRVTIDAEAVVQRCSVKKVFLKISENSQENTCARAWGMKSATLSKKGTLAQIFSCEFYEIFKDIFFYETHLVAASVAVKFFFHQHIKEICRKANLLFYLGFLRIFIQ